MSHLSTEWFRAFVWFTWVDNWWAIYFKIHFVWFKPREIQVISHQYLCHTQTKFTIWSETSWQSARCTDYWCLPTLQAKRCALCSFALKAHPLAKWIWIHLLELICWLVDSSLRFLSAICCVDVERLWNDECSASNRIYKQRQQPRSRHINQCKY